MHFCHAGEIWRDYPELVPGVVFADGITADADAGAALARFTARAQARLAASAEGALPEVQAWRRTFSRMGLKPTQYRCASESLLRRFRKENALPRIHPLIDLCNALSLATAIPIAAFDVAKIADGIEVRYATGAEIYLDFSGEVQHPEPREVIFADAAGRAHARRWTNRQSGHSAVQPETGAVLIVAEAMHASARADIEELTATLAAELQRLWRTTAKTALLSHDAPRFAF
jgi:DNA/RNA-binding domain of Phe-tRNA-synthetase-like protein